MNSVPPTEGSGIVGYVADAADHGQDPVRHLPGLGSRHPHLVVPQGDQGRVPDDVATMFLIAFNAVFWSLFEQAGCSLTLFTDRYIDLSVFGLFSISAAQTPVLQRRIYIILLAPLFAMLWTGLARRGHGALGIPVKFGLALMQRRRWASCSSSGARSSPGRTSRSRLWWLAGLYLFHTTGELCLSPVGLSR